jgi:hypothetical protein
MKTDLKTKTERRETTKRFKPGRDCVTQMRVLRSRPDVLANALREMGITENGDDVSDQERTE